MTTQAPVWQRSRSCDSGACVEVRALPDGVAVRDSKNPRGGELRFGADTWRAFLAWLRR